MRMAQITKSGVRTPTSPSARYRHVERSLAGPSPNTDRGGDHSAGDLRLLARFDRAELLVPAPCQNESMSADHPEQDLASMFRSVGSDRSDTWRLIRSIAEAFWGPILAEHRISESEVDRAEERLGVELPLALREGYRLLGAHPFVSAQDRLLSPADLTLHDSALVRFRVENQGCADWACSLGPADPRVYIRNPGGSWQPDAGSVSQFFVHVVLSEILFTAPFAAGGPADDDRIARLEGAAHQLPVAPFLSWAGPDLPPRRFFGRSGALIAEDARTWIWVAAQTKQDLDDTTRDLPGDWTSLDAPLAPRPSAGRSDRQIPSHSKPISR